MIVVCCVQMVFNHLFSPSVSDDTFIHCFDRIGQSKDHTLVRDNTTFFLSKHMHYKQKKSQLKSDGEYTQEGYAQYKTRYKAAMKLVDNMSMLDMI